MTITELIRKLEEIRVSQGDVAVLIDKGGWQALDVKLVKYEFAWESMLGVTHKNGVILS